MAGLLRVALEAGVQRSAFPKATVDVQCLVLEAGGGELAAAVAAASLALTDAGIPMRDLITSCTVVSPPPSSLIMSSLDILADPVTQMSQRAA